MIHPLEHIRNATKGIRPFYIGFALYLSFSFSYLHDILPITGQAGLSEAAPAWYLIVFFAANIFSFLCCAVVAFKRPGFVATGTLSVCAVLLIIIGITLSTIILHIDGFDFGPSESMLILVIAGFLLGAGDALMLLLWGRFCSTLSLRSTYIFVLSSYVVSLALYAVFVELPSFVTLACAVIGVALVPLMLKKSMATRTITTNPPTLALLRTSLASVWRPVFITATFAFMSNLTLFISGQQSVDVGAARWTSTIITLLAVLLMLLPALLFPKRINLGLAYRIALPVAAGGFLLLAFFWNSGGGVANSMVAMGWFISSVISWCIIANVAHQTKLAAFILFGISEAAIALASLLGTVIGFSFSEFIGTDGIAIMALALVAVYLLSTVVLFILKDRSLSDYAAHNAEDTSKKQSDASSEAGPTYIIEDRVENRCRDLAEQAQLTPRETEILGCLAQGRSTQYIAEKFTVSENTVKSHVKNVYQKLGVHSKQDVIDIINADQES